MAHSKTPWTAGYRKQKSAPEFSQIAGDTVLSGEVGKNEAYLRWYGGDMVCESSKREDIDRIVACVNFCDGLSTEQLERLYKLDTYDLMRRLVAALAEVE